MAAGLPDELQKQLGVSTHSHPKVAAPYIKKQEKSANWIPYFANWFYDKEFSQYNGRIAVIQID